MIFCTGIFARGDARYYTRLELPDTVLVEGVPTPFDDSMILDAFAALKPYTDAKLISVMRGILYDVSNIPDSNDAEVERRLKILCRFVGGDVKQIEIPAATSLPDVGDLLTSFSGLIKHPTTGQPVDAILKVDSPPERKARGK